MVGGPSAPPCPLPLCTNPLQRRCSGLCRWWASEKNKSASVHLCFHTSPAVCVLTTFWCVVCTSFLGVFTYPRVCISHASQLSLPYWVCWVRQARALCARVWGRSAWFLAWLSLYRGLRPVGKFGRVPQDFVHFIRLAKFHKDFVESAIW